MKTKKIIDSFKMLGEASTNITVLGSKINSVLNKVLPKRLLSEANIFNINIDLAQDLSKMIMLNVEDSLIEQNILIAQKELSVRGLSSLTGHHGVRPISAKGVISIKLKSNNNINTPTIIFNKTIFSAKDTNLKYSMLDDQLIFSVNSNEMFIPVIEGSFMTETFTAKGEKLEKIELDSTEPIENDNISVFVNGEKWTKRDSIYDMIVGDKSFFIKNGIVNQVDICFGDDVNGKKLNDGDIVEVNYLITSGESGIIVDDMEFSIISGVYDSSGDFLSIADSTIISVHSGFKLASNGEHIEITRNMAGYSSKSLTFVRPENIQAYLSRLSVISHIDAWSNPNDNQLIHLMLLPNIKNKLSTYSDYLNFDESVFKFSDSDKNEIVEYINQSQRQATNTELLLHDPNFRKYVCFVHISGNVVDKETTKKDILEILSREFLIKTFLNDGTFEYDTTISKNDVVSSIIDELGLSNCSVDFVSERNELAKIEKKFNIVENTDGKYVSNAKFYNNGSETMSEIITTPYGVHGTMELITDVVNYISIDAGVDPNLGFDEFGSIVVEARNEIPILSGGFEKQNSDGTTVFLDKPVYILYRTSNGFEEL